MESNMFMYAEYFGQYIYISPNEKIYCLYPFSDAKCLIMDEDITLNELKDVDNFDRDTSEVMVYWMYTEDYMGAGFMNSVRNIIKEYEIDPDTFLKKYNTKNRNSEVNTMENKEIKTVSPAEFFMKWKEMEDYWAKNDGDMDENSYYNRIINQEINIELPLLGIKTELFWCPPTVECIDELYQRMIDETYFDLLVEKEQCYYTGGGFWLAEVPFEYGDRQLVMVVDNENTDVWAVYQNVLKDNGKYESVEYDELLVESMDANHILPDWQIYYIKALQLLSGRRD